jgi:hypothetical protein
MLNVEIRFIIDGREVSLGSFAQIIVREVCASVREEFNRNLTKHENLSPRPLHGNGSETARQAVSVREAARLWTEPQGPDGRRGAKGTPLETPEKIRGIFHLRPSTR